MRRLLRALLVLLGVAYPVAVGALWLALALVGERWWVTTVALYLPRALFALPLPFLALALAIWGPRWLLLGQAAAAGMIVFPLMGLARGGPAAAAAAQPTIRLLSYNVHYGYDSVDEIRRQIEDARPDIVVLQASNLRAIHPLAAALAGFHTRRDDELYVASRYPIIDTIAGDMFMRYTLDTPLGLLDVYNFHPISPRRGFNELRGDGLRTGAALRGEGSGVVDSNADDRARQVERLGADARRATHPVIIAGDTNLPGLSPLLRDQLGPWQDGFSQVGRGLGYTFPAHRWVAWMRIDRILAGPELRFLRFEVGARRGSDHFCVWADLARR